jgi:homogentisate 1,2-dioxygenase
MNYEVAAKVIAAGLAAAEEQGLKPALVVVDPSGNVVASARMDGANYLAYAMAHLKAKTSGAFGMPTAAMAKAITDPLVVAALAKDPNVVLLGGGHPVRVAGVLVGAVGVSGGHYSMDAEVAQAAASGSEA